MLSAAAVLLAVLAGLIVPAQLADHVQRSAASATVLQTLFRQSAPEAQVPSLRMATSDVPAHIEEFKPWTDLCSPVADIPLNDLNLTTAELALLPDLCWRPRLAAQLMGRRPVLDGTGRGIPPGVVCTPVQWCDSGNACTDVCERGSVKVDPWLDFALKTQLTLARRVSLCKATLLGSHNSGITIADGYGNMDPYFQQYFRWIKWASGREELRTNDQWLSLTDQLNLGTRVLELDTHWLQGQFHIAHCGGFHSLFNTLITAVNLVAKLLHHDIRWDTETVGCDPSLSSIPTSDQRTFVDALQEVAAWLALPGNEREFVMLYLDDQKDIMYWKLVGRLLEDISSVFPREVVYTPPEHGDPTGTKEWPSIEELVGLGKRVVFVSGADLKEASYSVIFPRGAMTCQWLEPSLQHFEAAPACIADPFDPDPKLKPPDHVEHGGRTLAGQLYRFTSCEIIYGPLNCDFQISSSNAPLLDEITLPDVTKCGINVPSADMITPQRAAASIWSWAPGHPFAPAAASLPPAASLLAWARQAIVAVAETLGWAVDAVPQDAPQCASISVEDGRWRVVDCRAQLPTACRASDSNVTSHWHLQQGPRGLCPAPLVHELPRTPKDNTFLQMFLQKQGVDAAWLPVIGPDWRP